jgi:hypothetical protein
VPKCCQQLWQNIGTVGQKCVGTKIGGKPVVTIVAKYQGKTVGQKCCGTKIVGKTVVTKSSHQTTVPKMFQPNS